ncbi:MAG: hypothetical protein WBD22_15140 [Pyrinomonadaceae bacterium]
MKTPTSTRSGAVAVAIVCSIGVATACGPNQGILKSNIAADGSDAVANTTTTLTTFEKDLEAMRTANFDALYVFRRRDGLAMDSADRGIFREHTSTANRRMVSDDGKAVIVGTNYPIPAESLAVLGGQYAMENHSR